MICNKPLFWTTSIVLSLLCVDGVHAVNDNVVTARATSSSTKYVTCKAGQYLPKGANSCVACKTDSDRYYCPGGRFAVGVINYAQGIKQCENSGVQNAAKTACIAKTTSSSSLAKVVTCKAGQYLPKGGSSCATCKTDSNRYYCPGGSFNVGVGYIQGVKKCEDGKVHNFLKTACSHRYIDCPAGKYLPKGGSSCAICKTDSDRYYCPGGSFDLGKDFIQGIKLCENDRVQNSNKTACVSTSNKCKAGTYLPAGKKECKVCEGVNNYCPGGGMDPADIDQGIYSCPAGFSVNSARSGCKITLSKNRLNYGIAGNKVELDKQCWTIKEIEDFTNCVLGEIDTK